MVRGVVLLRVYSDRRDDPALLVCGHHYRRHGLAQERRQGGERSVGPSHEAPTEVQVRRCRNQFSSRDV